MATAQLATERSLQDRFPGRATVWKLRHTALALPRRPLLMGVINVTPDSFSDGGKLRDTRHAIIDTSKAEVAREAVAAGAQIINDVTGLQGDPRMVEVAVDTSVAVCAMHMQGTPQTMQDNPTYTDVVEEIHEYLRQRREALLEAGVDAEHICLDPGIGFGKTHQHNLTLLAHIGRFHDLGCPLLVGHSRKGFLAKVLGDRQADRTAATIGVALALARQGVQIIRAHDVRHVEQALRLFEAVGGIDGHELQLERR
jgi:dihydropteroate synthase